MDAADETIKRASDGRATHDLAFAVSYRALYLQVERDGADSARCESNINSVSLQAVVGASSANEPTTFSA